MNGEAGPEAERPEPTTASLARNFLIVAIALLLLKLLLVSRREMVPERMDAEGYASVSLDVWASIFGRTADHPPGASMAMAAARSLGIPYRIFTEIFLAAAAFLFFRPLVASMRLGIAAAAISYGLLLFHPTLILGMDRAVSDPVAFLCWLFGAGGIIGFVAAPQDRPPWWSLGLAIASFAFAGITRSGEGAIVFVEMVAIALLSIFLFRSAERWRRRRAIVACLCAVVANFAATQALSAVHFVNAGYWGAAAVESREWQQLYSALLSLPVQRNDRYVLANKAAMEMADSLSEDLRNMRPCLQQAEAEHSTEELPNFGAPWVITGCLPGDDSSIQFSRMRSITADILNGARERDLQLSAPVLGIIPRPIAQFLPDLPWSILRVASAAVRAPETTRVAQDSFHEELFNRALLRRAALAATGENPEVFGYLPFGRILYTVLAALFWPSLLAVFLFVAAIVMRSRSIAAKSSLIAFAISVTTIDVLCRISFYSMVDWILWEIPPRYILGASVLTVVTVSMLLAAWLPPVVGHVLGPKLTRFPGLWFWSKNGEYPGSTAHEKL